MRRCILMAAWWAASVSVVRAEGNARRFAPSPALSPYLTLDGSGTVGEGALGLSLVSAYERRPLIYFRDGQRTQDIISDRLSADLTAVYGVLHSLDVGLAVPLVLGQSGDGVVGEADLPSFATGDPALGV